MKAGILCPLCGKFIEWNSEELSEWIIELYEPGVVRINFARWEGSYMTFESNLRKGWKSPVIIEHLGKFQLEHSVKGCGFYTDKYWLDDFEVEFEFDAQNPDKVRFRGIYFRGLPWEGYIYKVEDTFFVSKKRIETLSELEICLFHCKDKGLENEIFEFKGLEGLSGLPYTEL